MTIKVWNAKTGKCQSTLQGHSNYVRSVVWSNDGTKLASGSCDKTVRIWSVGSAGTFECKSLLSGHSWDVTSVAWNNDGSKLATGSRDKTVRMWSLGLAGTFECQSTLTGHNDPVCSVCFSPCGTKIVSGGGLKIWRGGNGDFSIRMWDAETCTPIGSPSSGHSGYLTAVSYSFLFSIVVRADN
jgi:WD40 repeat protein